MPENEHNVSKDLLQNDPVYGQLRDLARGAVCIVGIYDTHVVKYRRYEQRKRTFKMTTPKMYETIEVQSYLSQHVPGCLPAWTEERRGEEVIVMPRAPGEICNRKLLEQSPLKEKLERLVEDIRNLGYEPRDIKGRNLFHKDGELYLVDYHLVKKSKSGA